MSMDDIVRQDARLAMLKALGEQPDGQLNSALLRDDLHDRWGVSRPTNWVLEELRYLASLGAISIVKDLGTIFIVSLTEKGRDHIERRLIITGVKRPREE